MQRQKSCNEMQESDKQRKVIYCYLTVVLLLKQWTSAIILSAYTYFILYCSLISV